MGMREFSQAPLHSLADHRRGLSESAPVGRAVRYRADRFAAAKNAHLFLGRFVLADDEINSERDRSVAP